MASAGGRLIIPNADPVYDAPGVPAANATMIIYDTGTTTPSTIYADIGLTTQISNPQSSNGDGLFYNQSTQWFANAATAYDAVVQTANGKVWEYPDIWPLGQSPNISGFLQNPNVQLTGVPTAPTPATNDVSSAIATTQYVNNFAANISVVPAGSVWTFAMVTPPSGYLICDGSLVSRSTYAALFAEIGTTWGPGDGTTTFALPDLRGYFVRGWSGSAGTIDPSRTFSSIQQDQFQGHYHRALGTNGGFYGLESGGPRGATNSGSGGVQQTTTANATTDGSNGVVRYGTETRPINIALLYAIKY